MSFLMITDTRDWPIGYLVGAVFLVGLLIRGPRR